MYESSALPWKTTINQLSRGFELRYVKEVQHLHIEVWDKSKMNSEPGNRTPAIREICLQLEWEADILTTRPARIYLQINILFNYIIYLRTSSNSLNTCREARQHSVNLNCLDLNIDLISDWPTTSPNLLKNITCAASLADLVGILRKAHWTTPRTPTDFRAWGSGSDAISYR